MPREMPVCEWQSMMPGVTCLPVASILVSSAGRSGRSATLPTKVMRALRTSTAPFSIGSLPSHGQTVAPVSRKSVAGGNVAAP